MSMMSSPVVMDISSSTMRVGFAGGDAPVSRFPCRVARPRLGDSSGTVLVGEKAVENPELHPKYPVHCGVILNWEDMEQVWHYVYDTVLNVPSESQPLVITEGSNPKVNREKMTQIMFETFKVPSLYVARRDVATMLDSGLPNGYAFHCGTNLSQCIPIYEGHVIPHARKFSFVAGEEVTWSLFRVLNERGGHPFKNHKEYDNINKIKEKMCYVALDYQEEVENITTRSEDCELEQTYELPDGRVVRVGRSDQFKCTEVLFRPILLGHDRDHELGVHELIHQSVTKYNDDDIHFDIVVYGGSTLFPGFFERLRKELAGLFQPSMKFKLWSPRSGGDAAWVGGSILASLPSLEVMSVSKEEYEECGPAIIHKKCF